jgi:hypothetical protein
LGADGKRRHIAQKGDFDARNACSQVWKETDWLTGAQSPENRQAGARRAAMNHGDPAGFSVSIHEGVEIGIVAFANHHRGPVAELGDQSRDGFERAEMSAHENGPATVTKRLGQDRAGSFAHANQVAGTHGFSPQQEATRQVRSGVHERLRSDASGVRVRQASKRARFRSLPRPGEHESSSVTEEVADTEEGGRTDDIGESERSADGHSDDPVLDGLSMGPGFAVASIGNRGKPNGDED